MRPRNTPFGFRPAQMFLISNNILGPGNTNKDTINLRDVSADPACSWATGKPFYNRSTQYFLIQDNVIYAAHSGAGIGQGMRTCYSGAGAEIGSYDHIIERNHILRSGSNSPSACLTIGYGSSTRFAIRNNLCDTTGFDQYQTAFDGQGGVNFHNNTCFRGDTGGSGWRSPCITGDNAKECYQQCDVCAELGRQNPGEMESSVCPRKLSTMLNNIDNGVTGNITRNPFVSSSPSSPAGLCTWHWLPTGRLGEGGFRGL